MAALSVSDNRLFFQKLLDTAGLDMIMSKPLNLCKWYFRLECMSRWQRCTWDPAVFLQVMDDGDAPLGIDVKEPAQPHACITHKISVSGFRRLLS